MLDFNILGYELALNEAYCSECNVGHYINHGCKDNEK